MEAEIGMLVVETIGPASHAAYGYVRSWLTLADQLDRLAKNVKEENEHHIKPDGRSRQ
jgi:hypothetical protein